MNDLLVYVLFLVCFVVVCGIGFYFGRKDAIDAAQKAVEEKFREKVIRNPMDEEKAINLNEELRKNKHDRYKDMFVMVIIAGLIVGGWILLWNGKGETNSSDARGWAVGALDTLLGVVVGYGFSKNDKKG